MPSWLDLPVTECGEMLPSLISAPSPDPDHADRTVDTYLAASEAGS